MAQGPENRVALHQGVYFTLLTETVDPKLCGGLPALGLHEALGYTTQDISYHASFCVA